ncbi:hypothetical protein ValSw33_17 [Vibrio phage ValSw3-3]|nr:hypothetical protein ValSw33_17 [Vibrio phage ValSw3-3]
MSDITNLLKRDSVKVLLLIVVSLATLSLNQRMSIGLFGVEILLIIMIAGFVIDFAVNAIWERKNGTNK